MNKVFIVGITNLPKDNAVEENFMKFLNNLPDSDLEFYIPNTKGVCYLINKLLVSKGFCVTVFNTLEEFNLIYNKYKDLEDTISVSFKLNTIYGVKKDKAYQLPVLTKKQVYSNWCKSIGKPDFTANFCHKCHEPVFDKYSYRDIATGKIYITGCPYCNVSFCD